MAKPKKTKKAEEKEKETPGPVKEPGKKKEKKEEKKEEKKKEEKKKEEKKKEEKKKEEKKKEEKKKEEKKKKEEHGGEHEEAESEESKEESREEEAESEESEEEAREEKEAEEELMLYTIPLRDAFNVPRKRRARKAVKIVKEFLARHTKSEVKFDASLNEMLWSRGIEKPPRRVRIKVVEKKGVKIAKLAE